MSNRAGSVPGERVHHSHDVSNVLLLASSAAPSRAESCTDLLLESHAGRAIVLHVDFTRSPNELIDTWSPSAESVPREVKIITVGQRSGSIQGERLPFDVTLERIGNAANLTELGVEITTTLQKWRDDPGQLVFCFHSVTPLLHYAGLDRAYRFIHVLTGHLSNHGAVAHYHMDPNAHGRNTIHKLKTLFDVVIEVDEAGDPEIVLE